MDALIDENWVADTQGEISLEALQEYLELWDILAQVELQEGMSDKSIFGDFLPHCLLYTAKSAYDALFVDAISFAPYECIWKSWSPPKCRFWLLTTAVGQQIGLLGEVSLIRIGVHYVIRRRRTFNICS